MSGFEPAHILGFVQTDLPARLHDVVRRGIAIELGRSARHGNYPPRETPAVGEAAEETHRIRFGRTALPRGLDGQFRPADQRMAAAPPMGPAARQGPHDLGW